MTNFIVEIVQLKPKRIKVIIQRLNKKSFVKEMFFIQIKKENCDLKTNISEIEKVFIIVIIAPKENWVIPVSIC